MTETTGGLLRNHANIIDSTLHRYPENAEIVSYPAFYNGDAIFCGEPNKEIMEYNFEAQELANWYVIRLHWASSDTGNLVNVNITDDINTVYATQIITGTSRKIVMYFSPQRTYKITISTGSSITASNGLYLDYIQMKPHNPCTIDTDTFNLDSHSVIESGTGSVTGDGVNDVLSATVVFKSPFDYTASEDPRLFITSTTTHVTTGYYINGSNDAIVSIRSVSGLPLTLNQVYSFKYIALGEVKSPFITGAI